MSAGRAPNAPARRLPAATFRLPVEKIRAGYYSDSYFVLTKELLEAEDRRPRVTMQVFAKRAGLLGGIDEAIAVLELCSGRPEGGGWRDGWEDLEVRALAEGATIEPWETVLTIAGDYTLFAHLETVYLGTLSRRSLVMVDSYGVGSALLRGELDFTADVVELDGRPCAKVGRELRPNPRLRLVE